MVQLYKNHADAVDVYSGTKVINKMVIIEVSGIVQEICVLQSSTAQANYLTNNENLIDYVDDTYVDIDYA